MFIMICFQILVVLLIAFWALASHWEHHIKCAKMWEPVKDLGLDLLKDTEPHLGIPGIQNIVNTTKSDIVRYDSYIKKHMDKVPNWYLNLNKRFLK